MTGKIEVREDSTAHRFELLVDGQIAGFSAYQLKPDAVIFTHTEITGDFGGQGLGGKLAAGALEMVREHGKLVVPMCPFIASFIHRHPEYIDLVEAEYRSLVQAAGPQ